MSRLKFIFHVAVFGKCLLLAGILSSQSIHLLDPNTRIVKTRDEGTAIAAGVVNVIIDANVPQAEFQDALLQLQNFIPDLSFVYRFPLAKKPEMTHDEAGFRLADLSRHGRLLFQSNFSVEEAIKLVNKVKVFSAIEPHFIPELCFTPNDDSVQNQYALERIRAFEAWAVEQGDTNVVIGISDTGTDLDHPDLYPNIAFNYADPINGIDDDMDGFVDNFYGWDLGEGDNNPQVNTSGHGVHVNGLSSAMTNNQIGIAGSGFRTRFLPIKITNASGALIAAYESIIFAADQGCQVINCSWGSFQPSLINQEIVRYSAINKGAAIFCGAGNNSNQRLFYPASYDFTAAVGSTGPNDAKSDFSNYGYHMDLYAPGENVLSTWPDNSYIYSNGTSMSSPVAAGCAAVVKSKFPHLTGIQILQLLKVTADRVDNLPDNADYINKMGYGRVNMFRALTEDDKKSVLLHDIQIRDEKNNLFLSGDTVLLSGTFTNLLEPTQFAVCNASVVRGGATLLNPFKPLGSMATLAFTSNHQQPFRIHVNDNAQINDTIVIRFDIWADAQVSTQYYQFTVNADFVRLQNSISTTLNSVSEIGKVNNPLINTRGFRFRSNNNLLFEGNFMVGLNPQRVFNMARTSGSQTDRDFQLLERISAIPSDGFYDLFQGSFDNRFTEPYLQLTADLKGYVPQTGLAKNSVILEYTIKNDGPALQLNPMYVGLFLDWDLPEFFNNRIASYPDKKLSFTYNPNADTLFVGAMLIKGNNFNTYAINLNEQESGQQINVSDNFTVDEKYFALSNTRLVAGLSNTGADVASVISSGPYQLFNNEETIIVFALIGASSLDSLLMIADAAQEFYESINQPTSILTTSINPINIYPNPSADGILKIKYIPNQKLNIRIVDLQGKEVYTAIADGAQEYHTLHTGLKSGMYILQVTDAGSQWRSFHKIVIER
ncbi:MAG: S8 family peptidase [Flavobacteriales bacterium]